MVIGPSLSADLTDSTLGSRTIIVINVICFGNGACWSRCYFCIGKLLCACCIGFRQHLASKSSKSLPSIGSALKLAASVKRASHSNALISIGNKYCWYNACRCWLHARTITRSPAVDRRRLETKIAGRSGDQYRASVLRGRFVRIGLALAPFVGTG